ncbi:uncharacterized protein GGS25DRAFT_514085 [Hypoxylon fragiforme]|uniref:uncharacterized protein n=1 Tax=Hypoxylon fragiforme TaxID=63214 RepID=UPI0020C71305|nr:uncharacterized protein GGS25DRAFT_514085 [Hypoxylon fragiforme]KAI2610198.1 hypothetical protein GGS25DRAFT_514085 [Hypoxylon fragiforme]
MATNRYIGIPVIDEEMKTDGGSQMIERSTLFKTRSLSDGGGTQLSSSPQILEASRRMSKDDTDSSLTKDKNQDPSGLSVAVTTTTTTTTATTTTSTLTSTSAIATATSGTATPVTPRRPDFLMRGLPLQMSQCDPISSTQTPNNAKLAPLSPKLDHSQIYASPTNILPRRSRGLDFSRAATSLHHSTLAEQSSPDSSPTIGGRAMSIPSCRSGEFGQDQQVNSLWSMMGSQKRPNIFNSVGNASTHSIASDSSSNSGDDDFMDDEMEDAIFSSAQVTKSQQSGPSSNVVPWMPSTSSAMNSLQSFRTRRRKHPKKKVRGLNGLGFSPAAAGAFSKSPPQNAMKEMRDGPIPHARRESISFAANQLHISGSESEDRPMESGEALSNGIRGVVKRAVTRRGNLLPKTKGFARIRAALAEENAPVDSEVRREAEVIRQVRESDVNLEPRVPSGPHAPLDIPNHSTTQSSPTLATTQEFLDDIPEDDMMTDAALSSSFKQQAMKNSKGRNFWEAFSETSSVAGSRTTPPPSAFMPRGSSSGMSEDVNMDSPGANLGMGGSGYDSLRTDATQQATLGLLSQGGGIPPTAAEITRRINNKRRRDDDFDPHSFKRRAVSPGMNSVHNSPITQSPLQRDMPWGSRPGSNHGADKASATPSENGSSGGNASGRPINSVKSRVGFQGMVDTNDGLMRMSIE